MFGGCCFVVVFVGWIFGDEGVYGGCVIGCVGVGFMIYVCGL